MVGIFQATSSLSDANKLIIRCAWAGNSAFDSTYGAGWVSGDCSLPPACTFTFVDKSLKTAVKEFDSNARAAIRKYGPIADWCVSRVTDMSSLFRGMGDFNADISSWDTSRVTTMRYMFQFAKAFNQPLSWDTSSVTDMNRMFYDAEAFEQLLSFNMSSVTDMRDMFTGSGVGFGSSQPPSRRG